MDISLLKTLGQVAAPAGLAIGVFLYLARDIIAKNIFPILTKEKAYRIILFLSLMAWSIALAGIAAWAYVELNRAPSAKQSSLPEHLLGSKILGKQIQISDINCDTSELYIFPKRIYFPLEYDKESKRYESLVKLTKDSILTIQESITWITQFDKQVCRVMVMAFLDSVASREYSLALAQRYADKVIVELHLQGINPYRMDSMSFGRENVNEIFIASDKASKSNQNTYVLIGVYLRKK